MYLLTLIASDLALMLRQVNLEAPLSIKLCKNLALQVMHLLCSQQDLGIKTLDASL